MRCLLVNPRLRFGENETPPGSGDGLLRYSEAAKEFYRSKGISIKNPSNPFKEDVSLGLLSLAAVLRKHHDVTYVQEASLTDAAFEKLCARHDVLLVTSYTPNSGWALRLARTAKKLGLKTVYGGPHATAFPELVREGVIDVIVRHEGEATIREIFERGFGDLGEVAGISFFRDGRVIQTPHRQAAGLDGLEPPAYELLDAAVRDSVNIHLETARGCPFSCAFCSETNLFRSVRYKSPERLDENVAKLIACFRQDEFHISDPTFNISTKRLAKIAPVLDRYDVHWFVNIALRNVTDDQIEILRRMKISGAFLGLESASDAVLERINKQLSFEKACAILRKLDFIPVRTSSWIFGLPGETKETIKETLFRQEYLLKHGLVSNVHARQYVPLPLTPIYNDPEAYGIRILDRDYDNYYRYADGLVSLPHGLEKEDILEAIKASRALNG